MNKKRLSLLLRSFDTPLDEAQRNRLDQALKNDPRLLSEKNVIESLRQDIRASGYGPFSPGFAQRVTACILQLDTRVTASPDLFYEALTGAFRKLAWVGGLAILVLSVIHITQGNALSLETIWQLTDDSVAELMTLSLF